jgi:hypothetical protein
VTLWQDALAGTLSPSFDLESEADARRVEELLALIIGARKVADRREAKIPLLVQGRLLRVLPERLDRALDQGFDVDPHNRPRTIQASEITPF